MIGMIFGVLLGVGFAFFALQNNHGVPVQLTSSLQYQLPMYIIIFLSFLGGLLVSFLLTLPGGIASFFSLRKKDAAITAVKQHEAKLSERVKELEAENTKLKRENRPSILHGSPRLT